MDLYMFVCLQAFFSFASKFHFSLQQRKIDEFNGMDYVCQGAKNKARDDRCQYMPLCIRTQEIIWMELDFIFVIGRFSLLFPLPPHFKSSPPNSNLSQKTQGSFLLFAGDNWLENLELNVIINMSMTHMRARFYVHRKSRF